MTELEARSRAAFAKRFPEIMARIERGGPTESATVVENGQAVDIIVDGKPVYDGKARTFAAEQVDLFLQRPLRMFMDRPTAGGLVSPVCVRMLSSLSEWTHANYPEGLSVKPVDGPTFLVSFGLGLGHHLEPLVNATEARWLVIVEPLLEFFVHSFQVVDWAALIERFDACGGIWVVADHDPRDMVKGVVGAISKVGVPFSDGAWVFTHYPSWAFTQARKQLHEAVEFAFVNRGFFEDELRMMDTALGNLAGHSFWLLEGGSRLRRPELAVIVGAGPSLDEAIDVLHEIRDRIVLFSAGTALRPLLRNGILPDFHCELENVTHVYDVISETAKIRDLSSVTLLASATVDPRVPPLFGDAILYFRDSVVSTRTLGRKYRYIEATAPTCVNMALSTAATMGFTNFVLFGTDCGVRAGADHHAAGTVYLDIDKYKKSGDEVKYPIELEGNFGGVVHSNWVYDACRRMLVDGIRWYGLNVVNCSDGALIPGAVPRVPEALNVTNPPVDRVQLMASLQRAMIRFAPGQIFHDIDLTAFASRAELMFDELDDLLSRLAEAEPDCGEAYRALMAFLSKAGDRYLSAEAIIGGTLSALPRVAMFFAFRVAEVEQRREVYRLFIREFREIARELRRGTRDLFHRVEAAAPAKLAAVG
jgi:hypothetical protein